MTTRDRHSLALGEPRLYIEVDPAREAGSRECWCGSPIAGDGVRCVHVISPAAGGEIRGYWLDSSDRLWLRAPCYTGECSAVDRAVADALDATVVPYTASAGGGRVEYYPAPAWVSP